MIQCKFALIEVVFIIRLFASNILRVLCFRLKKVRGKGGILRSFIGFSIRFLSITLSMSKKSYYVLEDEGDQSP